MDKNQLVQNIVAKKSFLCIGLDTDINKLPTHLLDSPDPMFAFNKAIVDATADLAVCYKPNLAFYEANAKAGWVALEKTVAYIRNTYPGIFLIADAKRADIGNTSAMYARAFFDNMGFDAVTVSPYMGSDSVKPFLSYPGKWAVILALTSNEGSNDFQQLAFSDGLFYQKVIKTTLSWGTEDNIMYVVGATKANELLEIRKIIPGHFLLVPGVGAQGGSLREVAQNGLNKNCGLLVNASRSVLYAGSGKDFDQMARGVALAMQSEMAEILKQASIFS